MKPMPLPTATRAALKRYAQLLRERAADLGLVAESDAPRIWERHIEDCLRAAPLFAAADRLAYDFGSGGGLPGIVLAVALPSCRFVLVESRRRRVAFLELAVETLGIANAEVLAGRVEELGDPADVVTARAFAPLSRTWPLAWRALRRGGRLLFWAGASLTDPDGTARALVHPEPPAAVRIERLATGGPLVMMARG